MTPTELLLAHTLINMAVRQCHARIPCGGQTRLGSVGKPLRCRGCPLDVVDALQDAVWAADPPSEDDAP